MVSGSPLLPGGRASGQAVQQASLVARVDEKSGENRDTVTREFARQDESSVPDSWLCGLTAVASMHTEVLQQPAQPETRPMARFHATTNRDFTGVQSRLLLDSALDELGAESPRWVTVSAAWGTDTTLDSEGSCLSGARATLRSLGTMPMQDSQERSDETSQSPANLMMVVGLASFARGMLAARNEKSKSALSKRAFFRFRSPGR